MFFREIARNFFFEHETLAFSDKHKKSLGSNFFFFVESRECARRSVL